jgi:hypothetical protein
MESSLDRSAAAFFEQQFPMFFDNYYHVSWKMKRRVITNHRVPITYPRSSTVGCYFKNTMWRETQSAPSTVHLVSSSSQRLVIEPPAA